MCNGLVSFGFVVVAAEDVGFAVVVEEDAGFAVVVQPSARSEDSDSWWEWKADSPSNGRDRSVHVVGVRNGCGP